MPPKRFVYRLEVVLKMKREKEEEEQKKLGSLRKLEEHERQVKAQLEVTLENVHIELKTKRLSGALNINELRFFPTHVKNLETKIKYQELRLQELAIKIVEQKAVVSKAFQERSAYEKHREKCHAEWVAEMDAAEAMMLDELATIKFSREARNRQADIEQEELDLAKQLSYRKEDS
jgi:flagellar export protein FliJ